MDKLKTGVATYMDEQDKGNGKQEEPSKTPRMWPLLVRVILKPQQMLARLPKLLKITAKMLIMVISYV